MIKYFFKPGPSRLQNQLLRFVRDNIILSLKVSQNRNIFCPLIQIFCCIYAKKI